MNLFAVLLVCTGNECRSPAAEHLLRAALAPADRTFELLSVGTRPVSGRPMHPLTTEALHAAGHSMGPHASRPIDRDVVRSADLILTAERAHRVDVVELDPTAVRRTFTLLEFADLAATTAASPTPSGPAGLVAAVAGGRTGRSQGPQDDMPDPIGGDRDTHDRVVAQLEAACAAVATALLASLPAH